MGIYGHRAAAPHVVQLEIRLPDTKEPIVVIPAVGGSYYPGNQQGGAGVAFGEGRRAKTTRPILEMFIEPTLATEDVRAILQAGRDYDVAVVDDSDRRVRFSVRLRQARFCGWTNFRANAYSRAGSIHFVCDDYVDLP